MTKYVPRDKSLIVLRATKRDDRRTAVTEATSIMGRLSAENTWSRIFLTFRFRVRVVVVGGARTSSSNGGEEVVVVEDMILSVFSSKVLLLVVLVELLVVSLSSFVALRCSNGGEVELL